MRKRWQSRWSLARLQLNDAGVQQATNPVDTAEDDAQKGVQLLHSVVSFRSFLCLFTHLLPRCVFFDLTFV